MFFLAILAIIYQFGVNFFKNGHDLSYDLVENNVEFKVREIYDKDENGYYTITLENDNYHFVYEVKDSFNKRKKIIEKLEIVEENNTMCIYPVYLNNTTSSNITCSKKDDNAIYSYSYYKDNEVLQKLVENLKSKKYTNDSWKEESKIETQDGIVTLYKENFMKDDIVLLWLYKSLYIVEKDRAYYLDLFDEDIYENKAAALVGYNYYIPKYNEDTIRDFASYYRINIKRREKYEISFTDFLSKNAYINAVIDDKIYVTDPKNLIQYEINTDNNKARKIGDTTLNAQYYDGTWHDRNINDFKDNQIKFTKDYSKIENLNKYKYNNIYETNNYYYLDNNGEISKVYKKDLSKRVVLFKLDGIKSVQTAKDTIYFIIDDTCFYYHENFGIRRILKRNELKYNYDNIYAVYKNS